MDNNGRQPLLSTKNEAIVSSGGNIVEAAADDDLPHIQSVGDFAREFWVELQKTLYVAAPSTFLRVCQYSLGAITMTFAGRISTLDLAAFSVENSVIAGFSFGLLLGMASALETLCGQAYGAGQVHMLGVYLQRSWVILLTTSLLLSLIYIFATQILKFIGETTSISDAAGRVALWMIPQLFAYALVFPIIRFLQAQRRVMAMAAINGVVLVLHVIISWLLMLKLGWGIAGGAAVLNASWWLILVANFMYVVLSGTCKETWRGFSWKAFQDLWGFIKLSVASAVMLCLETWYFMALILFAGYLKNAEVSVDALSISMNILGWCLMIALGFMVAVSVRVSNELGAGRPRYAKFAVVVSSITSALIGLSLSLLLIIFRRQYPALFSNSEEVQEEVYKLSPILAVSIFINNIQPVLSGVAIGAGWQAYIAYVNIGCYYVLGIPLGLTLGYASGLGVEGIWLGMLSGTCVQAIILFLIVYRTNWSKEASIAGERIRKWGGHQAGDMDEY